MRLHSTFNSFTNRSPASSDIGSVAVTSSETTFARILPLGRGMRIEKYRLPAILPPMLAAIGERHSKSSTDTWQILTPRHAPLNTLPGHLTFTLKWEGVRLEVLVAPFRVIEDVEVEQTISM